MYASYIIQVIRVAGKYYTDDFLANFGAAASILLLPFARTAFRIKKICKSRNGILPMHKNCSNTEVLNDHNTEKNLSRIGLCFFSPLSFLSPPSYD